MKSPGLRAKNIIFYVSFSLLLFVVAYYIATLNNLSLWGDELYRLSQMSLKFQDLIQPNSFNDPNYPTQIILFKLASIIFQSNDPQILVLVNLINVGLIFLGIFLIRGILNKDVLILFISLLFSSEFFIRMFFEINTYGFILGFSSLFSCLVFKAYFIERSSFFTKQEKRKNFIGVLVSASLLATIHPISGLFVCSVFFMLFLLSPLRERKLLSSLGFFFPICFLYFYGTTQTESHHLELNFKHILNTGAFIVPVLLLGIYALFIASKKKTIKKEVLLLSLPIVLSLIIIFIYSYLVIPMYQARYFMTLLPLTILVLLSLVENEGIKRIKLPLIFCCLLTVLFLYGPRSQIPYTNYQFLIEKSHTQNCRDIPIFFNKSTLIDTALFTQQKFDAETYVYASHLYSKEFQRKLLPYDELIRSIDKFPLNKHDCEIIGISGQKEQDVFLEELEKDLNNSSRFRYLGEKILADKCLKPGCGILWSVKQIPPD